MRRFLIAAALLTAATAGCDSTGEGSSGGGRLGVEGDSCVKTADCEAPLRCLRNVCTATDASSADGSQSDSDAFTSADALNSELPQIGSGADAEGAVDARGGLPDTNPPSPDAVAELLTDVLGADSLVTSDLGPLPELPPVGDGSVFSECESVGIAPNWSGTFAGFISYEVPFPIPGANSSDSLPVQGTLAFEVECIEKKLIVVGDMDGLALELYPFKLHLSGGYNPETAQLNAKMTDGSVALFDFGTGTVSVLFEGTLTGSLQGDLFEGTWQGEAVGTDPPGIPGTATGLGTWTASAQ